MAKPGYKALLIGNSTFPLDRGNLPPLEGPVNDVVQLREALTDEACGLFEPEAVRVIPERTTSEVLFELERFFSESRRDDCLLFYYSGHGMLNESNQLFLCARDSRTDYLRSTAISNSQINLMIDAAAAKTTVIVLDCCYSGAFKGGQGAQTLAGTGRYILSSSRASQLANDTNRLNGTSAFTSHLVEALREAEDRDGDGLVDLGDVYEFVHQKLSSEGRQIPQRIFAGGGEVAIAVRPVPARSTLAEPAAPPAPDLTRPPELALSETSIHIPAVTAGEDLPPERIEVFNLGGGVLEWKVDTDAAWIAIEREEHAFTLHFTPPVGVNRGRVTVTDGRGRKTVVRVTVEVRAPFLPLAPFSVFPPKTEPAAAAGEAAPEFAPAVKSAAGAAEGDGFGGAGVATGLARPRYLPEAPHEDKWEKWGKRAGAAVIPVVLLMLAATWLINAINSGGGSGDDGGDGLSFPDGEVTLRSRQGFVVGDEGAGATVDLVNAVFYFVNEASQGGAKFFANNGSQEGVIDLGEWDQEKLPVHEPPGEGFVRNGIPAVKDHLYMALDEGDHWITFRVLDVGPDGVFLSYFLQ